VDQNPRLSDEALARETEDALRVDPSPEFLARVRMRIAADPRPHSWTLPWTYAAAGAIAAVVVLALVAVWSDREADVSMASVSRPEAPATAVSGSNAVLPAAPSEAPKPVTPPPTAPVTTRSAVGAEVVIAPGERAALTVLLRSLRAGRIDPGVLETVNADFEPLPPLEEVTIDPIAIEPIPPLALLEGARP
jgi:hypothetical protein